MNHATWVVGSALSLSIEDRRVRIMTCLGRTARTPNKSKLRR
jgi:hypothetical protein